MRCAMSLLVILIGLVLISLAGALWFFALTVALPVFLLVKLVQSLLAMRRANRTRKRAM